MTDSTQADRDAAKEYDPLLWEIKPSCPEFQNLIQAFARHREQAAAEERAKIVAWLRKEAIMSTDTVRRRMNKALDQVEAGEHETFTRSSDT